LSDALVMLHITSFKNIKFTTFNQNLSDYIVVLDFARNFVVSYILKIYIYTITETQYINDHSIT